MRDDFASRIARLEARAGESGEPRSLRVHVRPASIEDIAPQRPSVGPESLTDLIIAVVDGEDFEPYTESTDADGKVTRGPWAL